MTNAYDCTACGKLRVYRYVDSGVTPMFVKCDCGGTMNSRMHRDVPAIEPTHEWYRPTALELANLSDTWQQHVENGGLKDRVIAS